MDLEKYRTELNSFNQRLQNANRLIGNTALNIFDFTRFKDEYTRSKTARERLTSLENMIHANHATANEQALKIENLLHELKLKNELLL